MAAILVADDEAKMRKILTLTLMEEGHEVLEAQDAREAAEIIKTTSLSLAITDLRMPGGGGMAVLQAVKQINHYIPVIILTAYGTIENAVEALKNGAHDYLLKPCDLEELKISVRKALQVQHLELENLYLRHELDEHLGEGELIGRSESMRHVFAMIHRVGQGDSTVLLRGESGTGKRLAARAIHRRSARSKSPFIAVNCAASPADLLELELFGCVKGHTAATDAPAAGKFELASGGTIFLNEISELPPRLQGKILRIMEEGVIDPVGGTRSQKVNARIVTATNADLEEKVRKGEIRSDLYYRLNVVPILMPPLRERKEDIPLLVEHFLRKKTKGRKKISFTSEDIEAMIRYHWPGNVRELENVVERAIVLERTDIDVLLPSLHPPLSAEGQMGYHRKELLNLTYKQAKKFILDDFENAYFSNILRKTKGNVTRAAELANVHRKNFHVKITELGIDPRRFTQSDAPDG